MAYWPTRTDVKFRDTAVREIKLFAERVNDLPAIIEASVGLSPTHDPAKLIDAISEKTKISVSEIRSITNSLQNVLFIKEELGSYEKSLGRIVAGVPNEIADLLAETRDRLLPAISKYDRNNPIALSYKAQRLTYLRDKLLHETEIMTDARPIFDQSGKEIIEFIVTHELVLTTYSNERYTREHISVDNADLLDLRKACDRALVKAQALKEAFKEKWPVEILRDDA